MKLIADLHTHTLFSTHAYSSPEEMIRRAGEMGLYAIALTDHGYTMPGSPGAWYFGNMMEIPHQLYGVTVLRGAEANVCDYNGTLDIPEDELKKLDWVVASIHDVCMTKEPPTVEACTRLWLSVAQNPYVRVIGHSGSPAYRYDYETVIPEFGRQGKLVEINAHSFAVRADFIPNCRQIALTCKKYGVPVVVDSDAHFSAHIAECDQALDMLRAIDFPEELILNANEERLKAYLRQYTCVLEDESTQ